MPGGMGRGSAMTSYKFQVGCHVGSKSVERAVADAVGHELASHLPQACDLPQRWLEMLAQLDGQGSPATDGARSRTLKGC